MQSVHFQWTDWKWQSAVAGGLAGLTTVVALHPLDIVRTRFQVHDGLRAAVPSYRHTFHALFTIGRVEGLRGLYAGLVPAVFGSSLSWSLYFFLYSNIKERNQRQFHRDSLGPSLHLLSAAEAGSMVAMMTNPVWVVKTRLQLQAPGHGARKPKPYLGFSDAFKSILREEGLRGLYKGLGPGLILVSHGALQFMAYEEGRKFLISHRSGEAAGHPDVVASGEQLMTSPDFVILGASSKLFAVMATYPYQVVRSRLQQRPSDDGVSRYVNTWHTFRSIMRNEILSMISTALVLHVESFGSVQSMFGSFMKHTPSLYPAGRSVYFSSIPSPGVRDGCVIMVLDTRVFQDISGKLETNIHHHNL